MINFVKLFDKIFYSRYPDNWDNILFRKLVLKHLSADKKMLDLGAGAGILKQMDFSKDAESVCGVDLDRRVLSNPFLSEAKVASAECLPYSDQSFDLVTCNNVLEHLPNPLAVFKEVRRVLKDGGIFLIKTPNKFHYVPIFARLTPHWFHKFYNKMRGRDEVDTFPVLYRVNSRNKINYYAKEAGFTVDSLESIEGRPEYLRINCFTYILGIIYGRILNSSNLFRNFRVLLIATLRKK